MWSSVLLADSSGRPAVPRGLHLERQSGGSAESGQCPCHCCGSSVGTSRGTSEACAICGLWDKISEVQHFDAGLVWVVCAVRLHLGKDTAVLILGLSERRFTRAGSYGCRRTTSAFRLRRYPTRRCKAGHVTYAAVGFEKNKMLLDPYGRSLCNPRARQRNNSSNNSDKNASIRQ